MTDFTNMSNNEFIEVLSRKDPVPGGGGASALVGAVGTALSNMVGSLTVGKAKYQDVEADMKKLMEKAVTLQKKLLTMMNADAQAFAPLAQAYGMPKGTEEEKKKKSEVMEHALKNASKVPYEIMELVAQAIDLTEEFAQKGSVIAISDAGVSAACLEAALKGAALNIFINTKSMQDRDYATELNNNAEHLMEVYMDKTAKIYTMVADRLRER